MILNKLQAYSTWHLSETNKNHLGAIWSVNSGKNRLMNLACLRKLSDIQVVVNLTNMVSNLNWVNSNIDEPEGT